MGKNQPVIGAIVLFGLCAFLSLNWHSHSPKFTYHSEIWADRAGYHVYLPAAFDYQFKPEAFPQGIDKETGDGFRLDSIPGKITTKYPCGEAILRVPFYLAGKAFRAPDDPAGAGFTLMDHAMIGVASAFYGTLGLLLLFLLVQRRQGARVAAATVFTILLGTNLLFYLVGDPGMSHVYSFFLFAAFIFIHDNMRRNGMTLPKALLLGAVSGLIIITRPTNILFIPLGLMITSSSRKDILDGIMPLLRLRPGLAFLLGAFILCIPQMAYWSYAFNTPIKWSYGEEAFTHLLDPAILPLWFAPYNGLFTYSPVLLVILLASLFHYRSGPVQTGVAWAAFILATYVSASWHAWTFGCGFGSRNFVEYGVIFAFPLAGMLGQIKNWRLPAYLLIAACCLYTFKLTYSYPTCWFGGVWDWHTFSNVLLGPFL